MPKRAAGLPKHERLSMPSEFLRVYRLGNVRKTAAVWIYSCKNDLPYSRIGISVKNRLCKNLVQRNRIKRIIREVYRLHKQIFGSGEDVVFVVKSIPEPLDYSCLCAMLCGSERAQ
ncbi:MAG: ribonuclease P protein component [Candidatus Omnitrophica bacterium]|nr:ribonuclease P protein component [Candidatus Omnitrophota bacterium]